MRKNTTRTISVDATVPTKGHRFSKRRVLVALFAASLFVGLLPASASARGTGGDLRISTVKAPVAPDGTTAGAALDFVVSFKSPNPEVDGVGMKLGGTITIELDAAFDLTDDQGPSVGPPAIILQGWPQSPRVVPTFPYETVVAGNTITLTMTDDWAVGPPYGPGPKAVHLALLFSTNPEVAGRYSIDVAITPDPGGSTMEGHGHINIIPNVRPSVNVVSLFSGPPGPPPPFFNPLYQDVSLGDPGVQVGMYLWERGGGPASGTDLQMINADRGRLVQDGRTVGQVWIKSPRGATDHTLVVSTTPSPFEGPAFVTGQPTWVLVTQFTPDPAVPGDYTVTFGMNGGNTQTMHYHVSG
jgi:hypothetical protein